MDGHANGFFIIMFSEKSFNFYILKGLFHENEMVSC